MVFESQSESRRLARKAVKMRSGERYGAKRGKFQIEGKDLVQLTEGLE